MCSTIYENNSGCGFGGPKVKVDVPANTSEVEGPFDSLVYVGGFYTHTHIYLFIK